MDIADIRAGMDAIIREDGPWTAHDIRLAEGLSTFPQHPQWSADGVRRFCQIITDVCRKPWSDLSILDLGCLEGLYAIEAGLCGAKRSVGIDIRPKNIRKANFARDVLSLSNVTLLQEDVRNLSPEKHGTFHAIVCSGLLYHLDEQDPFVLMKRLHEMSTGVVIIDTHISLQEDRRVTHEGYEYRGSTFQEHPEALAIEEQASRGVWFSVGNTKSFWLTKPSLFTALHRAGFTTVAECSVPYLPRNPDRLTLIAIPGAKHTTHSADPGAASSEDWPE